MELTEFKAKKAQLELDIFNLLDEFKKITTYLPSEINLIMMYADSASSEQEILIDIDVTIQL